MVTMIIRKDGRRSAMYEIAMVGKGSLVIMIP